MKNCRDLQVWYKAHSLTLLSYQTTSTFPKHEMYGLTSQIRRCANIAEGCGKRGNGEFYRFLNIVLGSASELEYHFLLARDLNFVSEESYKRLDHGVVETKRMLASLVCKIQADRLTG
jgi:four helix bundle protein